MYNKSSIFLDGKPSFEEKKQKHFLDQTGESVEFFGFLTYSIHFHCTMVPISTQRGNCNKKLAKTYS